KTALILSRWLPSPQNTKTKAGISPIIQIHMADRDDGMEDSSDTPYSSAPRRSVPVQHRHQAPAPPVVKSLTAQSHPGYRRAVFSGEERFCRNDPNIGSQMQQQTVCYQAAQEKAR